MNSIADCSCVNASTISLIAGSALIGTIVGLIVFKRYNFNKQITQSDVVGALTLGIFSLSFGSSKVTAQSSIDEVPDKYFACYCPTIIDNLKENWLTLACIMVLATIATFTIAHLVAKLRG